MSDPRYTVQKEWCGYPEQRWVVRFCGDWVGQRVTRREARDLAKEHNTERLKL